MKKYLLLLASVFYIWSLSVEAANVSTIDPTVPATDADLDSSVIRTNFLAAWNDITALWAAVGSSLFGANQIAGTLVAGPVQPLSIPSCFGPSSALQWTNGIGFGCNNSIATSNGSVSSVNFRGDGIFDSSTPSSAVTNTGSVIATPLTQLPNTFPAGPISGSIAAFPTWRALVGADLPLPTTTSLGGVLAITGSPHNFITGIATSGMPTLAQPACSDISNAGTGCTANTGTSGATVPLLNGNLTFSGTVNFAGPLQIFGVAVAPSATIDTTNATNITSGTLSNNRLAPLSANQVLGALTASTPSGLSLPSCSGVSNALTWISGTGFGCNTITGTGGVNITSSSPNLTVTPSPLTGTGVLGLKTVINPLGTVSPYTVNATDMGKMDTHASGSSIAVSLPQAGTTGFEIGKSYFELNTGSAPVVVTPTASNINGAGSLTLPACSAPPACPWAYLVSDGANWVGLIY